MFDMTMAAPNQIPAEFVYSPPASLGAVPPKIPYQNLPYNWNEEEVRTPTAMHYHETPVQVPASQRSASGPWAQRRIFVDAPASEEYQMYGRVPSQTLMGRAKDWVNDITWLQQQERRVSEEQPERYVMEAPPQTPRNARVTSRVVLSPRPERLVIDAPPQPVYERVVYVPEPAQQPQPQQWEALAAPQQTVVVAAPPPEPILVPLESEIVCKGHTSDRTELCFGCTLPPRQLKYDIVREEQSSWFGLCKRQKFKAVCRKCRATMPQCEKCGKQSVIVHP